MMLDIRGQSKWAEQSLLEGAKTASWQMSLTWPFLSKVPFSSLYRSARDTPLKLLSVLLQVVLYSMEFVGSRRAKPPIRIDIHDTCLLKMKNHIRLMIAVHINETQCDRDQVIAIPIELRPDIDTRMRPIPAWKLYHFNAAM